MMKKIRKYVKFLVCMLLIMSIVAPSFAANAASDGIAFVTKEEFDEAMADFNRRLITFETGINSKIDGQVTSYLDRNGIWSGKIQTINSKWIDDWLQGVTIVGRHYATNDQTYLLDSQKHVVATGVSGKLNNAVQLVEHYTNAYVFDWNMGYDGVSSWHEAGLYGGNGETGSADNYEDLVVNEFDKSGMCAIDYEFRTGLGANVTSPYDAFAEKIWMSSTKAQRNNIFHNWKNADDNVIYLSRFSKNGTSVNNGRSGIVIQTGLTMNVRGNGADNLVNTFNFATLEGSQMRQKTAWQEGDEIWEYFVVPQDDVVYSGTLYFFVNKGQRLAVDRIASCKVSRQGNTEWIGCYTRACLMTILRFFNCRVY